MDRSSQRSLKRSVHIGARVADMLIAATAHANRLPLYTRNRGDSYGLSDLVQIVAL